MFASQKGGEVCGTVDNLKLLPARRLQAERVQLLPHGGIRSTSRPPFPHGCPTQRLGLPACLSCRLFLCVLLACATGKRTEAGCDETRARSAHEPFPGCCTPTCRVFPFRCLVFQTNATQCPPSKKVIRGPLTGAARLASAARRGSREAASDGWLPVKPLPRVPPQGSFLFSGLAVCWVETQSPYQDQSLRGSCQAPSLWDDFLV